MRTQDVKTVKMFGPGISNPDVMVNRDVPECDVQAYKAAGYQIGSLPEHEPVTYSEEQAIAHNDGEDVSKPKSKKKAK